jgi:hypothetical protein
MYLALEPLVAAVVGVALAAVYMRSVRGKPLDKPRRFVLGGFFAILSGVGYGIVWQPEINAVLGAKGASIVAILIWVGIVVYITISLYKRSIDADSRTEKVKAEANAAGLTWLGVAHLFLFVAAAFEWEEWRMGRSPLLLPILLTGCWVTVGIFMARSQHESLRRSATISTFIALIFALVYASALAAFLAVLLFSIRLILGRHWKRNDPPQDSI